jgi:hypothetical protein
MQASTDQKRSKYNVIIGRREAKTMFSQRIVVFPKTIKILQYFSPDRHWETSILVYYYIVISGKPSEPFVCYYESSNSICTCETQVILIYFSERVFKGWLDALNF